MSPFCQGEDTCSFEMIRDRLSGQSVAGCWGITRVRQLNLSPNIPNRYTSSVKEIPYSTPRLGQSASRRVGRSPLMGEG